jgi:carboxymethylenebutenolidase
MAGGEMMRVTGRDGFALDAYRVRPQGARKGGVIVIQEIFGLSAHIQDMAERFAANGYEAIAPSMFDRAAPGFVVPPAESMSQLARGAELAKANGPENAMNDVGGCFDLLAPSGAVFVTGYCYGGSMSWLAAARIEGLSAASCYYGGNIPDLMQLQPKCPVICHFGARDAWIPKEKVDAFSTKHPDVPVYWYEADHGFARKGGHAYDAAADALAFQRTLDLFAANG